MKVETEKKTGKQDSERTITGQDFVVAKATGVVNGVLNRCGLHKKGLLSYLYLYFLSFSRASLTGLFSAIVGVLIINPVWPL